MDNTYPEEAVDFVRTWSKKHPRVANWQKFEEVFGTAALTEWLNGGTNWFYAEYKEPGVET